MKVRMADLWKPVKGVTIKEATQGKFLFHFAHPFDMEAVLNGGPWTFDNNMLLLEQVQIGMQIENIPLVHTTMWVQIHNLPMGLMKENVGMRLANYIGSFVEYDKNNGSSFWRQYMRVRVKLDVRKPLKRDTKVMNKEGQWCTVNFKYEKLGIFCFVCGIMGHAENKCEVRFGMEQDDGRREWSAEIRVDTRRQGGRLVSRWLREEKGSRDEHGRGETAARAHHPTSQHNADLAGDDVAQSHRSVPNQPITISSQNHSLPNLNARTTKSKPSSSNYSIPSNSFPNELTVQSSAITPKTAPPTALNAADSQFIPAPTINDFLANIITQPVTINALPTHNHAANNLAAQSLIHHTLTFNSQPITKDPPKPNQKLKKKQPERNTSSLLTRPTQLSLPSPQNIQPRPEKKTKIVGLNPTHSLQKLNVELDTQEVLEVPGEKKRRREEEETASATVTKGTNEHFLTAGPGSQACRDQ
jgi:14-3-3 protein epsilon